MDPEYQAPVDFGRDSSVASSSRVASTTSAPVRTGKRNAIPNPKPGGSLNEENQNTEGTATPGANSYHSTPNVWSSTPQRNKTRREFEHKIRERRHRSAVPNFPRDASKKQPEESKTVDDGGGGGLPLPKPFTDLLLQTAMAGIGTTAKLSRPGLAMTKNTLLPHLIIPLLKEIWEQYAPDRLQTWTKVVPTSLKNVYDLLWDTEAGQALGTKAGRLGENVVDMASSEVARQCVIDATVALIKVMEGLHTPEVKALLDQYAVGACRFVDVLSSGKAKQVWFDVSDALWALVEVGADPVMITSLAEGCAQVCFALERERDGLKQRRSKASAVAGGDGGDDGNAAKVERLMASRRRRERDQRQMGTYPPGKRLVNERGGLDNFGKALMDGLEGIARDNEDQGGIFEVDDFPQRVIVPTNSSGNMNMLQPVEAEAPIVDAGDDDESEITTDIEDLRRGKDATANHDDDVETQSSASDNKAATDAKGNYASQLAYEIDGEDGNDTLLKNQMDELEWRPHDDGTASEMYDAFDEPVLHFYRKLNEVLVETRKQGKFDVPRHSPLGGTSTEAGKQGEGDCGAATKSDSDNARVSPPAAAAVSKGLFGVRKKWWKLLVVAFILGTATMCAVWFALGCYGFYVIFLGGTVRSLPSLLPPSLTGNQPQSNIVIQLVTSNSQNVVEECTLKSDKACAQKNDGVASISLDDWRQLKLDVDSIISQESKKK